jgi:hypothetical protein
MGRERTKGDAVFVLKCGSVPTEDVRIKAKEAGFDVAPADTTLSNKRFLAGAEGKAVFVDSLLADPEKFPKVAGRYVIFAEGGKYENVDEFQTVGLDPFSVVDIRDSAISFIGITGGSGVLRLSINQKGKGLILEAAWAEDTGEVACTRHRGIESKIPQELRVRRKGKDSLPWSDTSV